MISDLKKEMNKFMKDLEKNIQDKNDLEYLKEKLPNLFNIIFDEMEKVINIKEEKINMMMQTQQELELKVDKIERVIKNIEKDIYDDDGFYFEIVCPYCDNEFVVDEESETIKCPKCDNIIELDWAEDDCCSDEGCSHCHGCSDHDEEDDDDM